MNLRFAIVLLLLLPVFSDSAAQEETPKTEEETKVKIPEVRQNIKADFKLPTPTGNPSFVKTVNGIADLSISYNYPVLRYFTLGGGFKFTYMQINDFKTNVKTNANIKTYTPFVRLGFEKFTRPKFFYGIHLKGGYTSMSFFSNICDSLYGEKGGPKDKGLYLEPEFSFYLLGSDNLAFGILFSYDLVFAEYGPDNVCLPNFSGLTADDSKGIYQYLSIGFGFSVSISDERKKRNRETIYW
ncbi:MAG: hypothetical protein ACOZCO_13065 [Bacteroidota bacterium]